MHNADVKIIENSPSNIRILNNGNINMREETLFCVPLGGELQFDYGTIKLGLLWLQKRIKNIMSNFNRTPVDV